MSRNSALTARARRYLSDAAHAFEHAPVEVTLSVLLAAAFSYTVSSDAEPFREWLELGIIIVLSGAVAFSATLMHALGAWATRTRWIVTGVGVALAALYGVVVLDLRLASEAWRAASLVAAAALLVLAAPALAQRAGATERFRRVSGRVLMRALAVLIYAGALYAGLALALGAVNTLFELDFDTRIYVHTFGWIFFVLVPWVVVGGVPDYVRAEGDAGPVAAAVHRISAFLVTPLLAIYYVILYAYAVRIALTGELPKNLVSPLVIAAGLIAGLALVLFDRGIRADVPAGDTAGSDAVPRGSAPHDTVSRGAQSDETMDDGRAVASSMFRSMRIAAPLFLPLCALGVWALAMRTEQYGWTEFRALRVVLLLTLGVVALATSVRALRRMTLPLHLLPLILAAAAVLSTVGPWNVLAASRRSQQERLADAMRAAGIEAQATSVTDTLVPNEPYRQIRETTQYLLSHFGPGALPPLFAQHVDDIGHHVDVVHEAGLRPAQPQAEAWRPAWAQLAHGAAIDDGTGGTLHYVNINAQQHERQRPTGDSAVTDVAPPMDVRFEIAGLQLVADMSGVARRISNGPPGAPLSPAAARVPVLDGAGTVRGDLYILEVGMSGDGALQVHRLVGMVRLVGAPADS